MTFKKIVEAVANGEKKTLVEGMISDAFQDNEISWEELNTLCSLVNRIG